MIIGFTGTRAGMSHEQIVTVIKILMRIFGASLFQRPMALHGDCVGADADFDALCRGLGMPTTCRPCTLEKLRAYTPAAVIAEPTAPMMRNKDIVDDADVMIACPLTEEPIPHSGTWATIGFSEKKKVDLHIVYPDGRHEFKEGQK